MRSMKQAFVYSSTLALAMVINLVTAVFKKMNLEDVNRKIVFRIVAAFGTDILEFREDFDPVSQKVTNKAILAMPSLGCAYYFKNGGCNMCGFNKEVEKYNFHFFHPAAISLLVKTFLTYSKYRIKAGNTPVDSMFIFMGGSFLNPEEMPLRAQNFVINFFAKSEMRRIVIESRPEYVLLNKDRLSRYAERCPQKQIEVAIGLEAVDDTIRNVYIKKNIPLSTYQEAVSSLKQLNFLVSTYVLVGAPFLSAKQITESAVNTAIYAWQAGSDLVNIEAYCVQKDTPWAKMYQRGDIKIPNLHNLVEIVTKINEVSGVWYLGKFSDWPAPIAVPDSCPNCRGALGLSLAAVRKNHDLNVFKCLPACNCNQ